MSDFIHSENKKTNLSKRLIILIALLLFIFFAFFLYSVKHFSPKKTVMHQAKQPIDYSEAESVINSINSDKAKQTKLPTINQPLLASHNEYSGTFLEAAGNASLSVYHGANQSMAPLNHYHYGSNPGVPSVNISHHEPNHYQEQNQQSEKKSFLKGVSEDRKSLIQSRTQAPLSKYTLNAGTIIPATLVTGIDSDLPGTIMAKVRRDVFDSTTGNYLLIPQGTTIIGVYDSQVAYGQNRVLIAWSRLIFPNGDSQNIAGQPGVDLQGLSGLHDLVNNHYLKIFGSSLMFSLIGAAGQLSQPKQSGNTLTTQQMIYAAVGAQLSQTGAQMVQKNMNIQPTLTIRPGANFNVLLTKDLILRGVYDE